MYYKNGRYLGNKNKQSDFILDKINSVVHIGDPIIGDLFSGTGSVSAKAKFHGRRVHANDYLKQCFVRANVILRLNEPPSFEKITDNLRTSGTSSFITSSRYQEVLSHLNTLVGEEGFFYNEYSPSGSQQNGEWERKYFTDENARKIDAVRTQITTWSEEGQVDSLEHSLLIFNLMEAVNEIANISGTYGCFLKNFGNNAKRRIELRPAVFVPGRTDHIVTMDDVFEVCRKTSANIIYLDPPFTKRQYATYYHILETIALEDDPKITGKTGIRDWIGKASVFCYKRKALKSLKELITILWPKEIFLSYSSDGHINKDEIIDMLHGFGDVTIYEYPQKRFKSNIFAGNQNELKEYLFYLKGGGLDGSSIMETHY